MSACTIPTSNGYETLLSPEDAEWAAQFTWYASQPARKWSRYATRGESRNRGHKTLFMHHEIVERMGLSRVGCEIDHRDGNSLNNQRDNLRLATRSQNCANAQKRNCRNATSQLKGVSFVSKSKVRPWCARIMVNYKTRYLGVFASEAEAALAYDAAARLNFGEFAVVNFPQGM